MAVSLPAGFPASTKTPGVFFTVQLGGAGTSPGTSQKTILIYGSMIEVAITGATPSFTVAVGTASRLVVYGPIGDKTTADNYFGRGSELSLGVQSVLACAKAATIYAIATHAAGTAATTVITCSVSTPTPTSVNVIGAGRQVQYNTTSAETATTLATGIATQIINNPDLPFTAQFSAGVVTITHKFLAARSNFTPVRVQMVSGSTSVVLTASALAGVLNGVTIYLSSSTATTILVASNGQVLPQATINITSNTGFSSAGQAVVVTSAGPQTVLYTGNTATTLTGCTGGTGTMSTGGAVAWANTSGGANLFNGGTGAESVAPALAVVAAALYDRQAFAYIDTTNAALLVTQLNNAAAITTGNWQQGIVPSVDTYANMVTLATTQNAPRLQIPWLYNSEYTPVEISSAIAAVRLFGDSQFGGGVTGELNDPASNLNGAIIGNIPTAFAVADRPTASNIENALNNGGTPLAPSGARPGFCVMVASITSRSLDAQSAPNFSVYKTKIVTGCDFVAFDMRQFLQGQYPGFKLSPDSTDGSPPKLPLTTTPNTVKAASYGRLKGYEGNAILINVDANAPLLTCVQDTSAAGGLGRLVMNIPASIIPDLDQVPGTVQQV